MDDVVTKSAAKAATVRKRSTSQWTAQFLVAAELSRRGYTVAFTMGNHTPDADLMVGTPSGKMFWIDVKGMQTKGIWAVTPKAPKNALYYVLVSLAVSGAHDDRLNDTFYVLTQDEAGELAEQYRHAHPNDKNKVPGFGFKAPAPHRDAWSKFPPAI